MKNEIIESVFEKMKAKDFGESMCDETKLKVLKWCDKQLHKHIVSNNEVAVGCDTCKHRDQTNEGTPCHECFATFNKWEQATDC